MAFSRVYGTTSALPIVEQVTRAAVVLLSLGVGLWAMIGVGGALPGAVLAAVGWVLLQAGFQAYAANAPQFRLYGVIGGVLLLVTWFYVAAILLLVGAAVNHVLAGTGSEKSPAPDSPD